MPARALNDADVVVAGCGPAGATIAALLASAGASVLALEKARFPRDKLCGEFVSPDGLACLERLGARAGVESLGGARIDSYVVAAGGAPALERPLPAPALGVSRRAFDDALLRHARERGARVREGCRVLAVSGAPRELTVTCESGGETFTLRAACVVDATGRLGGVRSDAAAPEPSRPEHVGLQEHRRALAPFPRRVELHAFDGGYVGFNAIEGGIVTACAIADARLLREAPSLDALLVRGARQNAELADRVLTLGEREGEARATARSPRAVRAPHPLTLAVGDAAGMIAPACGDGISIALRGAEIAAPIVLAHLAGLPWERARLRWERALRAETSARLAWGRAIEAALFRPRVAGAMLAAGRAWPSLADAVVRRTRGEW